MKTEKKNNFGKTGHLKIFKGYKEDGHDKEWYLEQILKTEKSKSNLEKVLKQQTSELIEIQSAHSRFISLLAHDLRNPFSSVIGFLQLLKEKIADYNPKEIDTVIDLAIDSANRSLSLLDELLVWSSTREGNQIIKPEKINLVEVIENQFHEFQFLADEKGLSLTSSVPSTHFVSADLMMLKTIFRNLISNAIKFTHRGGSITINSTEKDSFLEVSVVDTGVGISNQVKENLFKIESFNSLPGTENEKGTGFGLIICKEFVNLHGGDIYVKSIQSKGSEFIFTIPR